MTSPRAWFRDSQSGPITVAVILAFALATILVPVMGGGNYLTVSNIQGMLIRSVALGIVAVGQTYVILGGSIDLSVAYTVSVSAVLASFVMQGDPARIPLAIVVVLVAGVVIGLVNGLVVAKLKVNPLMATLATGLMLQGGLNSFFQSFTGSVPPEFQALGYNTVGPVPVSVMLLIVVFGASWWALNRTRFGYHLYAVGGDQETSRLSGVRTDRVLIGAHVLCSVAATITGLYIVSRLQAGAPWVGPDGGYDLESIAAVVMGGTALLGGRGGVVGTVLAVLILGILDSVFSTLQVGGFLKEAIRGVIIIVAVAAYSLRRRREEQLA